MDYSSNPFGALVDSPPQHPRVERPRTPATSAERSERTERPQSQREPRENRPRGPREDNTDRGEGDRFERVGRDGERSERPNREGRSPNRYNNRAPAAAEATEPFAMEVDSFGDRPEDEKPRREKGMSDTRRYPGLRDRDYKIYNSGVEDRRFDRSRKPRSHEFVKRGGDVKFGVGTGTAPADIAQGMIEVIPEDNQEETDGATNANVEEPKDKQLSYAEYRKSIGLPPLTTDESDEHSPTDLRSARHVVNIEEITGPQPKTTREGRDRRGNRTGTPASAKPVVAEPIVQGDFPALC